MTQQRGPRSEEVIDGNQIDGYAPTRENLWKLQYLYNLLRPQPGLRLIVQGPDSKQRQIDVMAKVTQDKKRVDLTSETDFWSMVREVENEDRLRRHRYHDFDDVFIWRMPQFYLDERDIHDMMSKAKKRKALILDLRGNRGGYEDTLKTLLGYLFDHDVKIGDIRRRNQTKSLIAKTRRNGAYKS